MLRYLVQEALAYHTPERTSRRIWRSFDCSIVSKHACTSTFTKYSFGLKIDPKISDINLGGDEKGMFYMRPTPDGLLEIRRV